MRPARYRLKPGVSSACERSFWITRWTGVTSPRVSARMSSEKPRARASASSPAIHSSNGGGGGGPASACGVALSACGDEAGGSWAAPSTMTESATVTTSTRAASRLTYSESHAPRRSASLMMGTRAGDHAPHLVENVAEAPRLLTERIETRHHRRVLRLYRHQFAAPDHGL